MNFYDLNEIAQDLFYFKDFKDVTEEIEALQFDKECLMKAVDESAKAVVKDDYESTLKIFNSMLKDFKSIYFEEYPVSLLNLDAVSLLILLSILLENINIKLQKISEDIVYLY